MFKKLFILATLIIPLIWLPLQAQAQEPQGSIPEIDWQELPTEKFIIVYANGITLEDQPVDCITCGSGSAEHYRLFIDDLYLDLARVFDTELQTPLNLRLFPTEESYYQVNPLARNMDGVIAHTVNEREEIAIALTRTQELTEADLVNNLRHEVSHLFAAFLSDGKLNTGFQEGLAQYLEEPDQKTEQKQAALKQAFDQGRLLSWAQLDDPEQFYSNPQVAYPQSISVVSFLVDRYGLATFIEFVQANAEEPGYRSALEATYGLPADELETEWLDYLPSYFEGRWQINAVYAYDLSHVAELVNRGAYTDAEVELAQAMNLLDTTDQTETLNEAQALMTRIRQGQEAATATDAAFQALQNGRYAEAIDQGNIAIAAYQQVGYMERIPEIQTLIYRAQVGRDALNQLDEGEALLNSLLFFTAEQKIYEATVLLQSLNNPAAAERGIELLKQSAERQRVLAYVLVGVGMAMLLVNGLRRLYNRFNDKPLEVELT